MEETIQARVGQTVEIALEAKPTAGFLWEAHISPGQQHLVEISGEWQPGREGFVGGTSTRVLRVRVLAPGEVTLLLVYRRPWELEAKRQKEVTIRIS